MAQAWVRALITHLILASVAIDLLDVVISTMAIDLHRTHHANGEKKASNRPMVLPLYFQSPNSSRQLFDGNRPLRRLHKSEEHDHISNAQMRLYDNLLTNGYYTTRLWIGTPPQHFALIVDSGSTVTYVPCSNCQQCGKHQDPRFQPELSSTYQPVKCNMGCNCDNERNQCTYERRYAEMSSSSGVLGNDIVSFGNESQLAPQHVVFGCENVETGDIYSQHADGIMGLGRGQLSIVDQLVEKGVIGNSFSLCYGGMDLGGGAMVLGGISSPADMIFTRSDPYRSPYYNIELQEIHVDGKPLELKSEVFNGRHGTVLDSGTTYAYLPETAFVAFKDAIMKKIHPLKRIHGPDPTYNDICFSGAGWDVTQLSKTFPEVDMVFSNGQKLILSPENYLFRHTKVRGAYCLGIFKNGNDQTTLLGGIIVRNTLVTYDRENEKIGFWKTNCSELWDRLHVHDGHAPSTDNINTTIGMPPSLAPTGMHPDILPGAEVRVGLITFDMSLRSDMKPKINELAEFIAHELEVNASQVHLLNFTFNGNISLIKWAIFPRASASYISSATAVRIILRLTEHHMQLPERFGSYQLVTWKVEPQPKRTWWGQHFLGVFIGVAVLVVVSISSFGIFVVWRHHKGQRLATYRPIVPEQELQQLSNS